MHKIRHETLMLLAQRDSGRFRDIHPKGVTANLFSYHLKALCDKRYVHKNDDQTYTLAPKGLAYVHRFIDNEDIELRPKLMAICVVTNEKNEVLLVQREKQPFRGTWTVPMLPMRFDDVSIWNTAGRSVKETVGTIVDRPIRVGETHLRVYADDELVSWVIADVFRATLTSEQLRNHPLSNGEWTSSVDRKGCDLEPGMREIVDSALNAHTTFFEEYRIVHER